MPEKYLVSQRENKCIGCMLCVIAQSKYDKRKLGIKDSVINIKGKPGAYKIQIDYGQKIRNLEKIVNVCPQNCFDIINSQK